MIEGRYKIGLIRTIRFASFLHSNMRICLTLSDFRDMIPTTIVDIALFVLASMASAEKDLSVMTVGDDPLNLSCPLYVGALFTTKCQFIGPLSFYDRPPCLSLCVRSLILCGS